jgi:hypothetical protein
VVVKCLHSIRKCLKNKSNLFTTIVGGYGTYGADDQLGFIKYLEVITGYWLAGYGLSESSQDTETCQRRVLIAVLSIAPSPGVLHDSTSLPSVFHYHS